MSTVNRGIITNGLVLCLDAANPKSIISGSTVWNDISRGGNNGLLINGPTFNSGNGGSLVFDGSNNYISISNSISGLFSNSSNNITHSFWIKSLTEITSGSYRTLFNVYTTGYNGGRFILFNRTTGQYSIDAAIYTTNPNESRSIGIIANPTNSWINVVVVWNGTLHKLFVNGSELTYTTQTSLPGTYSTNSTPIRLGAESSLSNPTFKGNMSNYMIYNRELSATEVLQNYNVTKSRFGY